MRLLAVFIFIAWFISKKYPLFLQIYAVFFVTLLLMATNKTQFGVDPSLVGGTFAPLSLARWITLSLFLLYSLDYFHRHRTSQLNFSFVLLCGLMLIDIMASNLYATLPNYSLLRGASILLLFVCLIFGVHTFFTDKQHCLHFIDLMYNMTVIVVSGGIVLYIFRPDLVYGISHNVGRYAGITGNANQLATFSAMMVPYVMFYCLTNRFPQSLLKKGINWGIWFLMTFGLYLSGSRSATISFVFISILYVFIIKPHARIPLIWLLMLTLLFITASFTLTSEIQNFFYRDQGTVLDAVGHSRGEMWRNIMPYLWEKPVLGYGFASSFMLTVQITGDVRSFHNSYLEVFGDLGFIGLFLLIALLGYIGFTAFQLIRSGRNEFETQIDTVFVCCFIGGLIDAFFESWMFSVGNNSSLMFWMPATIIVTRFSVRMTINTQIEISKGHFQY